MDIFDVRTFSGSLTTLLTRSSFFGVQYRPFKRLNVVTLGGRSTAIKMKSGDVWVLASTPLNDVTKKKLSELGTVKYIITLHRFDYK